MFSRHLVESAAVRGGRLELSVRLNWYRSLPLSCLERLFKRQGVRVGSGLTAAQEALGD